MDVTYRELAKTLHPDRTADPDDHERFKRVSAAYSTLRDPASRAAYDEFRARVANGTLYVPPDLTSTPSPPSRVDHLAPARVPRARQPMPDWLRHTIAVVLIASGLVAALWAAVGTLPAPSAADTPVAVQITLAIMAVKLIGCGAAVAWYPQLRARWHR